MKTRAQLEAQIADDLERSDLATQISAAVEEAILMYEKERFDFNDKLEVTVSLSSSANYIPFSVLPYRFFRWDRVACVHDANNTYEVTKRTYNFIKPRREKIIYAEPSDYCIYDEKILFDCGANANRTILIDGIANLGTWNGTSTTFSASSTAAWFNQGAPLIRAYAKASLYTHVLKDVDLAGDMVGAARLAFDMLTGRNAAAQGTGFIEPTRF